MTILKPHQPKEQRASNQKKSEFALPALRLEVRDLKHVGSRRFLDAVNAYNCMARSIRDLLRLLYDAPSNALPPATNSVTLILEDMPGVAYTTGNGDDKEVHLSVRYVADIDLSRVPEEIAGVVVHELVHCFQFDALGTAPGGLIEGIADWVRLKCRLAPPHWKEDASDKWDAGYQHTAYFLDYLDRRFGPGIVRRINEGLRDRAYDEKGFWSEIMGMDVHQLYKEYLATL